MRLKYSTWMVSLTSKSWVEVSIKYNFFVIHWASYSLVTSNLLESFTHWKSNAIILSCHHYSHLHSYKRTAYSKTEKNKALTTTGSVPWISAVVQQNQCCSPPYSPHITPSCNLHFHIPTRFGIGWNNARENSFASFYNEILGWPGMH